MALIQSTAIPSGATDYEIDQSLRFDETSNARLTRTPSSEGNRQTWTYSMWVKRGDLAHTNAYLFGANGRYGASCYFYNDTLGFLVNLC
jgi:hypothetical protein